MKNVLYDIGRTLASYFLCYKLRNKLTNPVILLYHDVNVNSPDPSTPSPKRFRKQLKVLKLLGYENISLSELIDKLAAGVELSNDGKYFVLTFDDGRKGVYQHAYPIMKRYRLTGTIFIVPNFIGKPASPPGERRVKKKRKRKTDTKVTVYMNIKEISELLKNGWEIGAHTNNHVDLTKIGEKQAESEIVSCRDKLEAMFGKEVLDFAYPFGSYNEKVIKIVKKYFRSGLTTNAGFVSNKTSMYELPRIYVNRSQYELLVSLGQAAIQELDASFVDEFLRILVSGEAAKRKFLLVIKAVLRRMIWLQRRTQ